MCEFVVAGLYADDTVLLAESEGMLQRIVDEFDRVCKKRKLKVNAGKSKVIEGFGDFMVEVKSVAGSLSSDSDTEEEANASCQ